MMTLAYDRRVRRTRLWPLTLILFLGSPVTVQAEPLYTLGQQLPQALYHACRDLASAQRQANAHWEFGKEPFDFEKSNALKQPGCGYVKGVVTLQYREEAIRPYYTWVSTYDKDASDFATLSFGKGQIEVHASPRLQEV